MRHVSIVLVLQTRFTVKALTLKLKLNVASLYVCMQVHNPEDEITHFSTHPLTKNYLTTYFERYNQM